MDNFVYSNPTRIIFGKNSIARLPQYIPPDVHVLLVHGGGSIQRNGVLQQVQEALANYNVSMYGGIEPNPRYDTCLRCVQIVREERVSFLLAVGGGSVLDATKFVALAACYLESADPWDFMTGRKAGPTSALPIGCVMTLPATGSEMNSGLVISHNITQEKRAFSSYSVYPQFSILDPETTYSLPPEQVANGIVDTFVHVVEQYVTYPVAAPLQNRQAEAILATVVEEGPKALLDPMCYDVRANLMWCAAQALNGLISRGVPQDWSTHHIGHEITALYDLPHARTLAVVLPGLWDHQLEQKRAKLSQFGRRVWGLEGDDATVAPLAIARTEAFFESLGVPTRFGGYGLGGQEVAERVCDRLATRGQVALGEHRDIGIEQVRTILASRD